MNSDTPRTEKARIDNADLNDWGIGKSYYVYASFARELERENNQLQAKVDKLEQQLHALRLVCGTTDANKFQTVVDRQLAKIAELEKALQEVRNWYERDGSVGGCDNLMEDFVEPLTKKDLYL